MVNTNTKSFWNNKKVFITGHTGFKGSWLCYLLLGMGAKVTGYSLKPPTKINLYDELNLQKNINSIFGDIRDINLLEKSIKESDPEVVFHLAAQPLVRDSYLDPLETYTTNIIGTANILESIKKIGSIEVFINVTTDKCYVNKEWIWPYRESDELGGNDPYSASKACSELVTYSYMKSFYHQKNTSKIASARAGNVIGGGDWADDRIFPDLIRAIQSNSDLLIRNPNAVRPWQHVLDPLHGYITLAESMSLNPKNSIYESAWNFGPDKNGFQTVDWILNHAKISMDGKFNWKIKSDATKPEANLLMLDTQKSNTYLNWQPVFDIKESIEMTMKWYLEWIDGKNAETLCHENIKKFNRSNSSD